jgi:hypothetical protein
MTSGYLPRWLEWIPSHSAEGPVTEEVPEAVPGLST